MVAPNFATLAVSLGLVALASLDCGGKLDSSSLPICPSDGTCSSDCRQTVTDCSGTYDLSCTCDATGHSQCPELGAPNCQADCDALMQGKMTCSIQGEKCMAPMQPACLDAPTLFCTCESGQFFCDAPPSCPPPPACPPPAQVQPGAACSMGVGVCDTNQAIYDCSGNVIGFVQCACATNGVFECTTPPSPPCPMDAGVADAILWGGG